MKTSAAAVIAAAWLTSSGCDHCIEPLSDWCAGPCPTYEEAMGCEEDANWRCGYAVVGPAEGWSGEAQYYNRNGTLVAVHQYSDINEFCNGTQHQVWFGRRISCDGNDVKDSPPCDE